MDSTSPSLLERLRLPGEDAAWRRFVELYTPLLLACGRRLGLRPDDAAELAQDVLALLVQKMPGFVHDGASSFRAWLRTVVRNRWLDRRARHPAAPLDHVPEPSVPDPVEELIERDHLGSVARRALALMRTDFEPATWRACWETAAEGRPVAEVAAELGLSAGAVYVARSRVLARLREELRGLVD
ncbi:MAG: sigma-70 family RNA polymerase sigma factor [Gemmataceae bacterium]|nr:sigma-70 family RNA polymerase sigma factor [Gemmataceae bacterium]